MRTRTFRKLLTAIALGLLATAATAETKVEMGRLKICKVAGLGVPVGTVFTFTADSQTITVPAGPAPGGYCTVGPLFPVGSTIPVTETLTNGNQVTNIKVEPPNRFVWSSGNIVHVKIGPGVTEVTFTNERTGYIQICKQTDPKGGTGTYQFYVNPGWLGPFTVPAGSCSPAIKVPAGTVTIHEVLGWGVQLVGCSTLPASNQISCSPAAGTSTVNVNPGDVSAQTIVNMINKGGHIIDDPTIIENPTNAVQDPQ